MATTSKITSNIALELAGMTASVNIPKPKHPDPGFWDGRESFAAVAAKSLNGSNKHHSGLPTPPNSFSPVLIPQGFKGRAAKAAVHTPPTPPTAAHVDSDIDLQDAVDHANAQDKPQHALSAARGLDGLADMDAAGVITPGLLAKHHLPGILLDHGPLAIRHVMGFLTTSVPGFSGIPPAKARRLVVGALEGRGSSGEHGGLYGDVIFEKVGWGRWDARRRGEASGESRNRQQNENPQPADHTSSQPQGLQIPRHSSQMDRSRKIGYGTSVTGESAMFSHDSEMEYDQPDENFSMLEQEAEKMSMDGDNSCSYSELLDEVPDQRLEQRKINYDSGEVTEDEDWRSIGAEALRNGSYPGGSAAGARLRSNHPYTRHLDPKAQGRGGPTTMLMSKSSTNTHPNLWSQSNNNPPTLMSKSSTNTHPNLWGHSNNNPPTLMSKSSTNSHPNLWGHSNNNQPTQASPEYSLPIVGFGSSNPQEREAIEALVKLSSV